MLSIIIINFNSGQLIKDCLDSVYKQTNNINFEIIVIDNSDNQQDKDLITKNFPKVIWLEMSYNAGFARANNFGIRQSKGDTVLLLNPDTIILNNAIGQSYTTFSAQKDYVACGVQLLNEDGSSQISGNFAMKGGLNYLLPLPYFGALLKMLGKAAKVAKPNVQNTATTVDVDWINGAYLMVKKSAIENAGLLDEDFFLYAEEAEWCSRLKNEGKLCVYGAYNVIHLQGETATDAFGSTDKTYNNIFDKKGLQLLVSNFLRIRKQFGLGWYFFDLMIYTFAVPLYYLIGFLHRIFILKNPFTHFPKANGLAKNVACLWKLMPKMVSRKPYFYKVL